MPLDELKQRYRLLFEHSPRSVYITTADGILIDANPACLRMFGIPEADKHTFNVTETYVDPAERQRLRERLDRDGQVEDFVVRLRDGSNRIRECAITSSSWRSADGQVAGYQGIIRDVTQEYENDRALRESVDRFQLLSRATNDVIYDWNVATDIVQWNDAIHQAFRYGHNEVSNTIAWWQERLHAEDRARVMESLSNALMSDHALWSAEYRFLRGDGIYAVVLDRGYIVRNDGGEAIGVLGSMVDLTDRRAGEEERRLLAEQLRQSQKMEAVGKLAGGIAHDFNNLLTAVRGHAELLLENSAAQGELREGLEEIARAAERASALTSQLLAFSRRQVLQPRVIDINSIVLNMEKMLARLIGEHIDLSTSLAPDLSFIKADPSQIEQVVLNLAVNARDAMSEGGTLSIETIETELTSADLANYSYVRPGKYILLCVQDSGTGMPQEVLDRAFEPFFTTKDPGKGTGLGLSTVYGIVKQSDGFIWAESQAGHGTTFRIYLPAMSGEERPVTRVEAGASSYGAETILVVEDEGAVRNLVRRFLEKRGYKVLTAEDGASALLAVDKHDGEIDLVVTDVVMPGMGGRELAQRLKSMLPNIRVLYTSGYTEDEIVRHGVVEQVVAFLGKPFTGDQLVKKVRTVLDAAPNT